MNNINNIFNKSEIENKLKDFQEGKDYSVSPTDEPNIKTYDFHNDKLRSVFRNDRVPVRVTQEAYDGKDYTYRGHFEEGKDYRYTAQQWHYDKDYQGDRGTNFLPDDHFFKGFLNGIKWDEHSRITVNGEAGNLYSGQKYWEARWTYRGKGKGNLNENNEPKQIEPNFGGWLDVFGGNDIGWSDEQRIKDLEDKISEWKQELNYLESQPKNEKINWKIERFRKDIKDGENTIRTLKNQQSKSNSLVKNDNSVNLAQENHQLHQELAEVKQQLAKVLEELKKLKSNSSGKDSKKLDQQIVHNEKLIKEDEKVSEAEIREQVQKSEALLKSAVINTTSPVNDNEKDNGSLPYLIGGSALLAAVGIIGYFLVKKNKGKKVA